MTLPAEIAVQELPDGGTRFVLPRRPLGTLRWVGLFPLAFGVVFAGFAIVWAMTAGKMLFAPGGPPRWFGGLFILFAVPFVVAGLTMAGVGILILAGHSEVEVRGGQLRTVERAGPLRVIRRRPAERVRRLKVMSQETVDTDGTPAPGFVRHFACIVAEVEGAKPQWVAPGYPPEWLRPLADALAERCPALTDTGERTPAPAVEEEVVRLTDDGTVRRDVEHQPTNSRAVLAEHPDGFTITLPPPGLRRGTKGLFTFAIIWCGFIAVFSAFFVPALVAGKVRGDAWVAYIIIPMFWAVGIGLMAVAVNIGLRRAALAVVGDRLLVMRTSWFGSKRDEWMRADVAAVEVGPSGITVNGRQVLELQIRPREGKKVGLLAGRNEEELHWIATRLRRSLGIT